MAREIIDLHTLQTRLKGTLETSFSSKIWLRAEVSSLKVNRGHCYMELSQNGPNGVIAKASAVIWSSKFRLLAPAFESVAGEPLHAGITILAHVQVNYSQLYGLSFVVDDIDAQVSLGAREMARRESIARLEREGLMRAQARLECAELPRRFAVISAADAAGYGDFMKHLSENPYGFAFFTYLFPAAMQGATCPSSIISALEDISFQLDDFDAVLILRGGGSELDLACFDDYELCSCIATFPLPIFTAIGHDRDYHIADMVAYQSVKTPTALADMIVEWFANEDARILSYSSRLRIAFMNKISVMEREVSVYESRIRGGFAGKIARLEAAVSVYESRIRGGLAGKITRLEAAVDAYGPRIRGAALQKITRMEGAVTVYESRIYNGLAGKIACGEGALNVLQTRITAADPRNIIQRGYVLALDGRGVSLRSAAAVRPGDSVRLMLPDGVLKCTVDEVCLE